MDTVGRIRLLQASNTLQERGSRENLGRAHFQAKALKQFKAEKGRAVTAGLAPNDFPLLATWCEQLWNAMIDEQKQKFMDGSSETLLSVIDSMIRA